MNHKVKLSKVKKGKAQELREWFSYLQTNDEVVETLKEENVFLEESFLFNVDDQWYCLYHMAFEDVLKESTTKELNKQHQAKLRDCLEDDDYKVLVGFMHHL